MPRETKIPHEIHPAEVVNVTPINKIFIANTGEIALRAMKTFEKDGKVVVLPYSIYESDNDAIRMVHQKSDDGWQLSAMPGMMANDTFANPMVMLDRAKAHGCDAMFLGYGFLSEKAEFIESVEQAGIRPIAPDSKSVRALGNKIAGRQVARETKIGRFSHVPTIEGTGNLPDVAAAVKETARLRFPIILKDPDGGGGKGQEVVYDDRDPGKRKEALQKAYEKLKMNPDVKQIFAEEFIEKAAHIEIQVIADQHGNVVSLGERDCTLQRKNQKVIEESPSISAPRKVIDQLNRYSIAMAKHVGLVGPTTFEFLYDLQKKEGFFIEANTRIQVEHGVTEEQVGIDLVHEMTRVAEGHPLSFTQADIKPTGHTFEYRVYAENSMNDFSVSPGELSILEYPQNPNVRIDTAAKQGDKISGRQDHLIAKVIVHADTREQAMADGDEYLSQLKIAGVETTIPFLRDLSKTPEVKSGKTTTRFIENWWRRELRNRVHSIQEFINGGEYHPVGASQFLDLSKSPEDVIFPQKVGPESSYSKKLQIDRINKDREMSAEYGIVENDGTKFVVYNLDYDFRAGTLDPASASCFIDAVILANKNQLPLVSIVSSGGVEQGQNTVGLSAMNATVAALERYPVPLFINIYKGLVYGGVPASFAGVADVEIAVNSPGTRIGFTGPRYVAQAELKTLPDSKLETAYNALDPRHDSAHRPTRHFGSRNIDLLVDDLAGASEKVTHLIHVLGIKNALTRNAKPFKLREESHFRQLAGKSEQLGRPGMRFPAWIKAWNRHIHERQPEDIAKLYENLAISKLSIGERLKVIQEDANRATAFDILRPEFGVFDDVFLLSHAIHLESNDIVDQAPPVIAAVAKLDGQPVMVIAHQTQLVTNRETRKVEKRYVSQKPEDWEYAHRMMDFAQKQKLPIIFIADTKGGDATLASEDRNQSHKIGKTILKRNSHPYPILSVGAGYGGSGGAITFLATSDAAADFEHALTFVSQPEVMFSIITGGIEANDSEKTKEQFEQFISQLNSATAEGRLSTHQIDEIIKEKYAGYGLKKWLVKQLAELNKLSPEELKRRRFERSVAPINSVMTPNQEYKLI